MEKKTKDEIQKQNMGSHGVTFYLGNLNKNESARESIRSMFVSDGIRNTSDDSRYQGDLVNTLTLSVSFKNTNGTRKEAWLDIGDHETLIKMQEEIEGVLSKQMDQFDFVKEACMPQEIDESF